MANQLIEAYRANLAKAGMTDPTSDDDLTLQFGQMAEQQNRAVFDRFPDFGKEYSDLREANAPGLGQEVANAAIEGTKSLGATMVGGAAALTGSDYLATKAHELEEPNPDRQATIQSIDDIAPGSSGISKYLSTDALRYAAGKIGGAVPALAEGVATSAIGGVIGGALGPEGAVAGAVEGFGEGMLGRGIIKSAIKDLIKNQGEALVERKLVKNASIEAMEAALQTGENKELAGLVMKQAKSIAARRGSDAANALNAYVQSAGMIKNETGDSELALGLGAISAIPNTILPHMVMQKLFPGVALEEAAKKSRAYVTRLATKALETGGIGASAGAFQEATNIVAKNLKDGNPPLDFSEGDWKRLRESSVGGGLAGALVAPVAALENPTSNVRGKPQPEAETTVTPPDATVPPDVTAPAGDAATATTADSGGVSVPFMVTNEMGRQLRDLGYTIADINKMKPAEAQEILKAGVAKDTTVPTDAQATPPDVAPPADPMERLKAMQAEAAQKVQGLQSDLADQRQSDIAQQNDREIADAQAEAQRGQAGDVVTPFDTALQQKRQAELNRTVSYNQRILEVSRGLVSRGMDPARARDAAKALATASSPQERQLIQQGIDKALRKEPTVSERVKAQRLKALQDLPRDPEAIRQEQLASDRQAEIQQTNDDEIYDTGEEAAAGQRGDVVTPFDSALARERTTQGADQSRIEEAQSTAASRAETTRTTSFNRDVLETTQELIARGMDPAEARDAAKALATATDPRERQFIQQGIDRRLNPEETRKAKGKAARLKSLSDLPPIEKESGPVAETTDAVPSAAETPVSSAEKPEYRYAHWQEEKNPDGSTQPAMSQVDLVKGGESVDSKILERWKAEGVALPDVPKWLPSGQYTEAEIHKAIVDGPPKAVADPIQSEGMVAKPAEPKPGTPLPAQPATPIEPFIHAEKVEQHIDFLADPRTAKLSPEEIIKKLPDLVTDIFDSDGHRSKTRAAIILQAPDGHIVKAGVTRPQGITDLKGRIVAKELAVHGMAAQERDPTNPNRKNKFISEKGIDKNGKNTNPALLSDVIAAGYKPIHFLKFDGEPGKIFQTFPNERAFNETLAATERAGQKPVKNTIAVAGGGEKIQAYQQGQKLKEVQGRMTQILGEVEGKTGTERDALLNEYLSLSSVRDTLESTNLRTPGVDPLDTSGMKYRQSTIGNEAGKAEHFQQAVNRLRNLGIRVDIFAHDFLSFEKAGATGVEYGPWHIALGVDDVLNANVGSMVTLMHEGVHSMVDRLGLQDPNMKAKVLSAATNLMTELRSRAEGSAERNGIDLAHMVDAEDHLAESLAQRITADGVPSGPSIAKAVVRWVKDLYYRTAMALQAGLGIEPSDKLALDWVENQFRREIGGDYEYSLVNLLDRFQPPRLVDEAQSHSLAGGTPRNLTDFVGVTLEKSQPRADLSTVDGIAFNRKYRQSGPVDDEAGAMSSDEARARYSSAAVNHEAEVMRQAYEASGAKMPFEKFWRFAGRGDLPEQRLQALDQDAPGKNVSAHRLDDPNQTQAMKEQGHLEARILLEKNQAKAARGATLREQLVARLSTELEAQAQKDSIIEQNFRDAEMHSRNFRESFKQLMRDTNASIRRGKDLTMASTSLAEALRESADITERGGFPPDVQKFMETAQWEHVNLMNYLGAVSKLDLDLGRMSIRDIVKEVKSRAADNPTLAALVENRPLLAATVALARDHAGQMDLLQLGRHVNSETFLKVTAELKKISSATEDQLRSMLKSYDKSNQLRGLEERVKQKALERRSEIRTTQEKIRRSADEAEILRQVQTFLNEPVKQLQQTTGAYSDFAVVHGSKFTAMRIQEDGTWKPEERTLSLNNDGSHVNPKEIAHDLVQNRRWLIENKADSGSYAYERIRRATDELGAHDFFKAYKAQHVTFMDKMLQPLADKAASAGGAGQRIKSMMFEWQRKAKESWSPLETPAKWWEKSMLNAEKAAGISDHGVFKKQIYDPIMYMLGSESGLDEQQAVRKAVRMARQLLTTTPADNFTQAISEMVMRTKEVNDMLEATARKNNIYVEDPRLGSGQRKAANTGFLTVMRKVDTATVMNLSKDMLKAGWKLEYQEEKNAQGQTEQKVVKASTFNDLSVAAAADPMNLRQQLEPLFTPKIVREWLEPFMNKPGEQLFTYDSRRISQQDVQHAWHDANADVVGFIDQLGDRLKLKVGPENEDPRPAFRVSMLKQIDGLFGMEAKLAAEATHMRDLFDPQGPRPHAMMDARLNNLLPAEHLDHQTFDALTVRSLVGQLAFHNSFGRNGEKMVATLNELKGSVQTKVNQFNEVMKHATSKAARKIYAEANGWDLKDLEATAKNAKNVEELQGNLEHLFGFSNSGGPMGDIRPGLAVLGAITGQIVNNPKTGLFNFVSESGRAIVQRSLSMDTIGTTAYVYKEGAKQVFGGLLEAFGMHMLRSTEHAQEVAALHGSKFSDLPYSVALAEYGKGGNSQSSWSDQYLIKPLSQLSNFQRKGLVGSGHDEARQFLRVNAVPGVGGIMHYLSQVAAVSSSLGNVRQLELIVKRGMDYYKANPDKMNDPTHRFTAKDLGMQNHAMFGSEGVFDYYKQRALDYRIGNLEDITRGAIERTANGEKLLTKEQVVAASQMAANEINLEASVNTRVGAMSTNPILKYGMPLIGWSLQQTHTINQALKTIDGQRDALTALKTIGRLAMWSLPMGVAFSLAMDQYDEKLLGKKSNLAGVDWQAAVPFIGPVWAMAGGELSAKQNFLGMFERQARAGNVYGMGGDLAAQIISPQIDPQSGQRAFSLDSRVLAMSQFLTVQQAITNFINQDFTATYPTVTRPLLQAMGGNGALHAVDLINNALGLDNEESRMVARTNATAWLRAAGREAGVELVGAGGASSSPTPITPWVREMQLASYANDRYDFQQAYQKALNAAREMGEADPQKKILESWRSRNPLAVFKGRPSPEELNRVLNLMNDQGRASVQSSIRAFNEFTTLIAPSEGEKQFNRQLASSRGPSGATLRRQAANIYAQ